MANKSTLEQMLEHLVNDDQQKAEELFHEYVVTRSREIYENLIENEMVDDEEGDDQNKNKKDGDVEEGFDEFAEADDEMDLDSDDPTDDLADKLGDDDMEDEEGDEDKSPEDLFQDLDAIVDELQAKFDAMGGDDMGDDDMGDMDDEPMKDEFDLETVREYVEKVPAGHGAEKKGQAEKADGSAGGMKFSANNMGGTTANFRGGEAREASKGTAGGLANNKPQDMKTGNINTPGAKNGNAFSKKEPGHGAEKKGAAEGSTDGQSLFRGRR
jgi:hypothetical protein